MTEVDKGGSRRVFAFHAVVGADVHQRTLDDVDDHGVDVGRQASVEELAEVEAGCSEMFPSRRIAAGADQLAVLAYEDLRRLDDPIFGPAGDADDLVYPTSTISLGPDVHDKVDAGRDGWHDEWTSYVLAGEQRQRAHLALVAH